MPRSISVIIPTLNEEDRIGVVLRQLNGSGVREVIVVDGGSRDSTVRAAEEKGARVFREQANRGRQQNLGADRAQGSILLFLHADTTLPQGFADQVRSTLSEPGISAGAFRFKLDAKGWQFRLVEIAVAIRCRFFKLPYGDQGIFVHRDAFTAVGGFAAMSVMEDFDLIRRLKKLGRVEMAHGIAVTSARRWLEQGVWRLTWTHQLRILGYLLGFRTSRVTRLRRASE